MSKLAKLTFYSKLYDLFDSTKPKDMPAKIQEAILFIKKALVEYESENGHQDYIHDKIEILKDLQRAFEDAMSIDSGWGFCITNGRQKHQVNLRPINEFLEENVTFIGNMHELSAIMQNELLTEKNINEFKKASFTIREMITAFDEDFTTDW
jgi:hypothetical protein